MRKTYLELKEETRQKAIDWQLNILEETETPSLDEFVEQQEILYKLGKKYGLLQEFKENGIV